MKRHKYFVDFNVHPDYRAYWIVRLPLSSCDLELERLPARHKAVKWAKKREAFYDTDKMVPEWLF